MRRSVTSWLLALALPFLVAAPASPERASHAFDDQRLLEGLLAAFEPAPVEIRALRIENLGLLADPRALPALGALLHDPRAEVAEAAARAIGSFDSPDAESLLTGAVQRGSTPDTVKRAALHRLVFQRRPSARRFLEISAADERLSVSLQQAARTALTRWGPPPSPQPRSPR